MKKTIFLIIFLLVLVSALLILNLFSDINRDAELEDIPLQESGFMKLKERNPIISNIETDIFRDSIIDVTSKKDSILPIDNPVYSSVSIADEYLNDTDKVFIYEATEGVFFLSSKNTGLARNS
jgi:hypothetical protein